MEKAKEEYGLVYKNEPPYEVLYTKWLPYADVLKLKGIEEMVEVYYNSGQFQYTLKALEKEFSSAFQMYESLAVFYEQHKLHQMSHSRVTRYEILLDFVKQVCPDQEDFYKELLTFDLYLRENAKTRPDFAGESLVTKEWLQEFYDREAKEPVCLRGYTGYDKRQMRKMTHVEKFTRASENICGKEEPVYVLFDYQDRNPLDHQATCYFLQNDGKEYKMANK